MLKASQKLRVIVSGVSFYATAKQVRNGIGDMYSVNAAVQKCLLTLEHMRKVEPLKPIGLGGTWENRQVQVDMML